MAPAFYYIRPGDSVCEQLSVFEYPSFFNKAPLLEKPLPKCPNERSKSNSPGSRRKPEPISIAKARNGVSRHGLHNSLGQHQLSSYLSPPPSGGFSLHQRNDSELASEPVTGQDHNLLVPEHTTNSQELSEEPETHRDSMWADDPQCDIRKTNTTPFSFESDPRSDRLVFSVSQTQEQTSSSLRGTPEFNNSGTQRSQRTFSSLRSELSVDSTVPCRKNVISSERPLSIFNSLGNNNTFIENEADSSDQHGAGKNSDESQDSDHDLSFMRSQRGTPSTMSLKVSQPSSPRLHNNLSSTLLEEMDHGSGKEVVRTPPTPNESSFTALPSLDYSSTSSKPTSNSKLSCFRQPSQECYELEAPHPPARPVDSVAIVNGDSVESLSAEAKKELYPIDDPSAKEQGSNCFPPPFPYSPPPSIPRRSSKRTNSLPNSPSFHKRGIASLPSPLSNSSSNLITSPSSAESPAGHYSRDPRSLDLGRSYPEFTPEIGHVVTNVWSSGSGYNATTTASSSPLAQSSHPRLDRAHHSSYHHHHHHNHNHRHEYPYVSGNNNEEEDLVPLGEPFRVQTKRSPRKKRSAWSFFMHSSKGGERKRLTKGAEKRDKNAPEKQHF